MYTSLALLTTPLSLFFSRLFAFQTIPISPSNSIERAAQTPRPACFPLFKYTLMSEGGRGRGGEQQQRRIERENKDRLNERQQSSSQWLHLVGDDWIGKLGIIRSQPKGVHCAIACRKGVGPVAPPVASQQLFHQKPFQPKAKAEKENL